jgi:hypothetical protein
MRQLTPEEVHASKTRELGLDPDLLDLTSAEALAAALRRAAAELCPCAAASLRRAVVGPLRGLAPADADIASEVERVLEAMVAYGDLLEHRDVHGELTAGPALLYTAPPSFVPRGSGGAILLGVAPDHGAVLPPELEARVDSRGHVRRLEAVVGEELGDVLCELGLLELSHDDWLRAPAASGPEELVRGWDLRLDAAAPSLDVPGLVILEPHKPVRYYRGRWGEPRAQTGRFVGRRAQAYGADLWCYVELSQGRPQRLVDLPTTGSRWRGCDEAWHLQMAIDARAGAAQRFRLRPAGDAAILELFSPAPGWARRRWDAIGEVVTSRGSLFAYRLPATEAEEERRFLCEQLWLEEDPLERG